MYSAWRSEVRQWVWCEAVWVAVACEMHGLARQNWCMARWEGGGSEDSQIARHIQSTHGVKQKLDTARAKHAVYACASQYPPYKDFPYAICSQPHRTGPNYPCMANEELSLIHI